MKRLIALALVVAFTPIGSTVVSAQLKPSSRIVTQADAPVTITGYSAQFSDEPTTPAKAFTIP